VNRQPRSVVRLAGALLIAGLVVAACGRHGAGQDAGPVATVQPASPGATAAYSPDLQIPPAEPTAEATADTTAAGTAGATEPPTAAADTTADPIAGDIQSIDTTLKGIDGSLSGADAGTNGGE
jgi:hypothetical protein